MLNQFLTICSLMIVDPHCVRSIQPVVPFPIDRNLFAIMAEPEVPFTGTAAVALRTRHDTVKNSIRNVR
jgi:hypothetical protein